MPCPMWSSRETKGFGSGGPTRDSCRTALSCNSRQRGWEPAASNRHHIHTVDTRQKIKLTTGLRVGLLNPIKMLTSLFQLVAGETFEDLV